MHELLPDVPRQLSRFRGSTARFGPLALGGPTDSAGHEYVEVDNVRITYVPATDRKPGADWSSSDVVRFQAYKSGSGTSGDKSLHMGAELPVASPEAFIRLISAVCRLYSTARSAAP